MDSLTHDYLKRGVGLAEAKVVVQDADQTESEPEEPAPEGDTAARVAVQEKKRLAAKRVVQSVRRMQAEAGVHTDGFDEPGSPSGPVMKPKKVKKVKKPQGAAAPTKDVKSSKKKALKAEKVVAETAMETVKVAKAAKASNGEGTPELSKAVSKTKIAVKPKEHKTTSVAAAAAAVAVSSPLVTGSDTK